MFYHVCTYCVATKLYVGFDCSLIEFIFFILLHQFFSTKNKKIYSSRQKLFILFRNLFFKYLIRKFFVSRKIFFFPLKVLSFDCFSSQKGLHGSLGSDFVYLGELDQSSLPTLFSLFPLIRIKLPTLYLQKFPLGPKLVY